MPDAAEIIALMHVLQISCMWLLFGDEEKIGGGAVAA